MAYLLFLPGTLLDPGYENLTTEQCAVWWDIGKVTIYI